MSNRVYISGRMSGLSELEYRQAFNTAEERLRARGYKVFNPSRWTILKHVSYRVALGIDILMMSFCDRAYFLKGWTFSNGAMAEHTFARSSGMVVEYE